LAKSYRTGGGHLFLYSQLPQRGVVRLGWSAEARCGVVASNIAEGKGRRTDREFLQFLHHARGSVFEVETQLTIASRLGYMPEAEVLRLGHSASEIARMLNGLIKAITSITDKQVA